MPKVKPELTASELYNRIKANIIYGSNSLLLSQAAYDKLVTYCQSKQMSINENERKMFASIFTFSLLDIGSGQMVQLFINPPMIKDEFQFAFVKRF